MADLYSFAFMIILSLSSLHPSLTKSQEIRTPQAMDELIKNYTFNSLGSRRIKTGEIYNVDLPANLTGIRAKAARFRCGSLKRYGAKFDQFELGVGISLRQCMVRVMVIVHNLGLNWSSIYYSNYNLARYQLVSPILGLAAYDYNASDLLGSSRDKLGVGFGSITINFTTTASLNSINGNITTLCAIFQNDGIVRFDPPISPRVCESTSDGHYGLVVEISLPPPPPPPPPPSPPSMPARGKRTPWRVVLVASLGAVFAAIVLVMAAICVTKAVKGARMGTMERNGDGEEYLPVTEVGNVRVPVAGMTRTPPSLESETTS